MLGHVTQTQSIQIVVARRDFYSINKNQRKVRDFRKRVNFQPPKVSVLGKIGVFFSLKISGKGSFFKVEKLIGYTFYIEVGVRGIKGWTVGESTSGELILPAGLSV